MWKIVTRWKYILPFSIELFVTNVNIIGLKYELHVELLPVSDISMNLYENCYAIASVLNDSSATVMFASLMRYILIKLNKIILLIWRQTGCSL